MTAVPSHVDLLAMARAVRRAAVNGPGEALRAELSRLRTGLVRHLLAEERPLSRLDGAVGRVTREGQERLLALVNDVLGSTEDDDGTCNWIVRTAEFELRLRRQARLESAVLGHEAEDRP
jgi:hypothetical protein